MILSISELAHSPGRWPIGSAIGVVARVYWIVLACRLARGTDQVFIHSQLRVRAQAELVTYKQAKIWF